MEREIVIVEDQETIRDMIGDVLQISGFTRVVMYDNPFKAREAILEKHRTAIIVADFQMPDMTGIQLLDDLSARLPGLGGTVVTADPAAARNASSKYPVLDKGSRTFVSELVNRIRSLMDAEPAHCGHGGSTGPRPFTHLL